MKRTFLTFLSILCFFFAQAQDIYLRGAFTATPWDASLLTQTRGLANTYTLNTLSGTQEFKFGTSDWTTNWGANATVGVALTIAPNIASTWYAGGGNASVSFVAGRFYTFNLVKSTNIACVLQTAAQPVSITTVSQTPLANAVNGNTAVTVNITTSGALGADENVYVRYSTNGFTSSSLVKATMTGATGVATIPGVPTSNVVQYYVYTSPLTIATIATAVANFTEKAHDVFALKTNGSSSSPYFYMSGIFTNTSASPGAGAAATSYASNAYGVMACQAFSDYANRQAYIYPKSVLSPFTNGTYINAITFFREFGLGAAFAPGQSAFRLYLANTTADNWGAATTIDFATITALGAKVWDGDPAANVGTGSTGNVTFSTQPFLYTGNNLLVMVEYGQTASATSNTIRWFMQSKTEVPQYTDNQTIQTSNNSQYNYTYLSAASPVSSNHPAVMFGGLLPVIPIELVRFDGKKDKQSNLLTWQTATERGVKEFALERSADGKSFAHIGIVKAAGNSTSLLSYNFSDNTPLPVSYYRLRTIDFDGKEEISKVISIQDSKNGKETFVVYPNPTTGLVSIESEGPLSKLVVFNTLGQVVKSVQNINSLKTTLDLSDLDGSIYFIKINVVETRRVMMQH